MNSIERSGFGQIVNRKDNIFNGFNDVEKGIEFIKTEKEIFDKIASVVELLQKNKANILGVQKEIMTMVGTIPSVQDSYYMGREQFTGDSIYEPYLRYDLSELKEEQNVSQGNKLTNLILDNDVKEDGIKKDYDEKDSMKKQYNTLCKKVFTIDKKINELNKTKNNLKSNSKRIYNLSFYDLEQYGF